MKVVSIQENDIADSITGVNVSVWFAGCPHRCLGCHNFELWDDSKYADIPDDKIIEKVIEYLKGSPIEKGLSVLGGEPLSLQNINATLKLIEAVRAEFPKIKIYVWTGYTYEVIKFNNTVKKIVKLIDYLIDGPFILEKKAQLKLRGSSNQRILTKKDFNA